MSMPAEEDVSVQLLNAMGDGGAEPEGTPPVQEPSSPEVDLTKLSPFSQNFLAKIPEADRPVVARHMGSWDSGFTQHSQRVNGQLQPYTQLGSPDELRTMKEAFEQLKADPDGFVNQLIQMGVVKNFGQQPAQQQPPASPPGFDPAGQGQQQQPLTQQQRIDLAKEPEIQRLQRAFGAMAQQIQQRDEQQAVAQAEQQIDQELAAAESKYGKFNRGYVLQLMRQGLNTDAAVQAWNNEVQQAIASQRQAPRVVSASSAPPVAPGPLNSSEDRAAALRAALEQMQ